MGTLLSVTLQNSDIWLAVALILLVVAALCLLVRWHEHKKVVLVEQHLSKYKSDLVDEKLKSHDIQNRFSPPEAEVEILNYGSIQLKKYKTVTVLFAEVQGFTEIADKINAEVFIDQLDKFYYRFDSVVKKYAIEKIKTIGDTYMCAGGIPIKNQTNPIEVVLAALEMLDEMTKLNAKHRTSDSIWGIRMGIDTGTVIADVVDKTKQSYDIWGSTVNVAARMQAAGEAGQINITENTYLLVNKFFSCQYRGVIPIKNKGDVKMYYINGIVPHLSVDGLGIYPNADFFTELQFFRLADLEEFMLQKLEKELPKNLYYHNVKHTIDVYTQVELIGRKENVTKEDMLLLRTAALLHDSGHLFDYNNHEEMGVRFAQEILPRYKYSPEQIQRICELILATKLPPEPHNLLEQIMCDADLDYLGRNDFIPVSNLLFKELLERGFVSTIYEWNQLQIKFIKKHQYFTKTAINQRDINKSAQLESLKSRIHDAKE